MPQHPAVFWRFVRCRFSLRIIDAVILPPYKGALWRGSFGHVFRKLVCLLPSQTSCPTCILTEKCLYAALFEPTAPPDLADAAKYLQAPRPFVLVPPLTGRRSFHPDDTLYFDLVLIGPAIEALPYFIFVFQELGKRGWGRQRRRFALTEVEQIREGKGKILYSQETLLARGLEPEVGPVFFPADATVQAVTLNLLTPVRLKVKGDLATDLTFPLFWEHLSRRLELLAALYGPIDNPPDVADLTPQAGAITVADRRLYWYDWQRYSHRQQETMKLGGLKGSITFAGPLGPFMPYLRLGEHLHVGQGTTFGLGRYKMGTQQTGEE